MHTVCACVDCLITYIERVLFYFYFYFQCVRQASTYDAKRNLIVDGYKMLSSKVYIIFNGGHYCKSCHDIFRTTVLWKKGHIFVWSCY